MTLAYEDVTLIGNDKIEKAIHQFYQKQTQQKLTGICLTIRERMLQDGHMIFPADITQDEDGSQVFTFKTLELEGEPVLVAFTSLKEQQKGPEVGCLSTFIDTPLETLLQTTEIAGLLINPWGESICLGKENIAMILNPGSERLI